MGRIRNFFNRIFGRKQKSLPEQQETYKISEDDLNSVPEVNEEKENLVDNNFKDDLQKNTIQKEEMSFNETLDYFIQSQRLEPICKSPRGRERLEEMLTKVLEKHKVRQEDGVYSLWRVENALEMHFGKPTADRTSITFEDREFYASDYDRNNSEIAPGCQKTTISVNEYGELSEVTEGRGSYLYNRRNPEDKNRPTQCIYSRRERHYEKTGVEDLRIYEQADIPIQGKDGYQKKPSFDYALFDGGDRGKGYPNYYKELGRRQDGITADVAITEHGELKISRAYINSQYGVDNLNISNGEYTKKELPYYRDMTEEQKEKFNEVAKDAISRSKYKEALVSQTPGIEMEDLEQNKSIE